MSYLPQWAITLGPFTKGMNTPASFCNINLVIAYPPRAANEGGKEGGEIRVGLVTGRFIRFHAQQAVHCPYGPVFCNLHRSGVFQAYE